VSHYDCLDFLKLAALPVAELAADGCALFLWAVDPLLPRAFEFVDPALSARIDDVGGTPLKGSSVDFEKLFIGDSAKDAN
jgi:hypothetical protein